MPLDWLFGSKKKAEHEPPSSEEKPNSSGDDFVMLEGDLTGPSRGLNEMYPQLPYALGINHGPGANPEPLDLNGGVTEISSSHHEVPGVQGFLSGVPFKLTTADTFQDIDSATAHHLRASQLITNVSEGIASDRFTYDFQVEKSVLHEAGCRDLG